ncbi:hypothetical protein [Clostridium sp.]|jgi:hypothetical protein|uniref:hypothetical protein n=1 Tax=Clostridium sp. TaxID=1506 RepID=UPI003EEEB046
MFIRFALMLSIVAIIALIGEFTRRKGFSNLKITRSINKNRMKPHEEFTLTTTIEDSPRTLVTSVMS